ncbi:MAG: competence/damage-inducible protein A [Candidatus Kapaibacteriales bacterium]
MNRVAILSIGDEICIGQIINSNSAWIAQRCTEIGYQVISHSVVRDDEQQIADEVDRLTKLADVILVTGGLGPTSDDLTKPALAKYFKVELVFNEQAFQWIKDFYSKRGIKEILERNKNLANLPANCRPLQNSLGTAPGMLFEFNGKILVSMPGVPKEMQFIMNNSVLPLLKDKIIEAKSEIIVYRTLQTCGIAESMLAENLKDLEFNSSIYSLAYLPSYKGVRLRIGAKACNYDSANLALDMLQAKIEKLIGDYIYGIGEITLADSVGKMLLKLNKTIAVAESCTAGLLGAELTKLPGSSGYFLGGFIVYSNEVKVNILGVKSETIQRFGAVSEETAIEMADNVRKILDSDFGISITGIAGPGGGTPEKPIGTVWIGLADRTQTIAKKYQFGDDREINRERSVAQALTLLFLKLREVQI